MSTLHSSGPWTSISDIRTDNLSADSHAKDEKIPTRSMIYSRNLMGCPRWVTAAHFGHNSMDIVTFVFTGCNVGYDAQSEGSRVVADIGVCGGKEIVALTCGTDVRIWKVV